MKNKLKILQIGSIDWSKEVVIPDNMDWYYFFPHSQLAIKKVMENTAPDHIVTASAGVPKSNKYNGKNGISIV